MGYNLKQSVDGEIEYKGLTINYTVTWCKDYPSRSVYLDSIDDVSVYQGNEELPNDFYEANTMEINELIENYSEPDEWEEFDNDDYQEYLAECEWEAEHGY